MSQVNAAELHKSVADLWDSSGLDWEHKKFWTAAQRVEYPSLHDTEATPGQPFPYTVFNQQDVTTVSRMSGLTASTKRHIRDVPWQFRVFTRDSGIDTRSAKEVAADLADFIMQKYGEHPDKKSKRLVLNNGRHLITQYISDQGVRVGDEEYLWNILVSFRIDFPVTV